MRQTRVKLKFYRKVRAALLATNKKTDNAIITSCNIVKPLADDKGISIEKNGFSRKRVFVSPRSINTKRSGTGSRVVKF